MFNECILIGRICNDLELRTTPNGVSVCSFCIAVDRPYSKDKEKQADFINCVAWRERAEFVTRYFGKGKPILVEGSIQTRNYEDKNGNKRTATEVVADNVRFVGGKDSEQVSRPSQKTADVCPSGGQDFEEIEDGLDSDLPF